MRADKRQLNEHGIRLGWSSLRDFAITLCVAPLDGSSTYLLLCLPPTWSPPFQTAHQVPMPLALRLFLIRDRLPPTLLFFFFGYKIILFSSNLTSKHLWQIQMIFQVVP